MFVPSQASGPTATPIVEAGRVYTVGANGHVHCLEARQGRVLWEKNLGHEYQVRILQCRPSPLIEGNLLILYTGAKPGASVMAVDKMTGKEVWKTLDGPVSNSSPLVVQVWQTNSVTDLKTGASIHLAPDGDAIYLFTDKGDLIRAQVTPQGYREISRAHLLKPTFPFGDRKCAWTPPAYANQHVFARNDEELVCASLGVEP